MIDCNKLRVNTITLKKITYQNEWLCLKAMAHHSSTLAWMEEPGRLQSMVLLRVGHD